MRATGHGTVVSVRITVLGCSGSVVGPDSPASGYLLRGAGHPAAGPRLRRGCAGRAAAIRRSRLRARAAVASARRPLPGYAGPVRVAPLPPVAPAGQGVAVRPERHLVAAGGGVVTLRRGDRRLLGHLRRSPLGRRRAGDDRHAHGDAAGGRPPDRVLRPAGHRPQRAPRSSTAATPASAISSSSWPATPTSSSARPRGRTRRIVRPLCTCRAPRPAGPRPRRAFASCC